VSQQFSCQYTALEQEALLHVTGPDARTFLQGQLSCDTRKLTAEHALPGLYCTPKGRIVSDFLLCQLAPDHLALRLRRDVRAAGAAALAKYIVFSRASLDAQAEDWQLLACWGAGAPQALAGIFGAIPRAKYGACTTEQFVLVQVDDAGEQFECYFNSNTAADLPGQLKAVMQPAPQSAWQALQITSGTARIQAETTGEYIPQTLNYDCTGHISFSKGCYTGQEVVARMHYRGKSKTRLYLASLEAAQWVGTTTPAAGTTVYSSDSGKNAGEIINCATSADGHIVLLLTATADAVAAGLRAGAPEGPLLQLGELPYSLDGR
jgi:tRNA-modifying protein YgfZ